MIHEVFVKQQEKQETELQLLRTQINPHYLYNTLEIMHMKAYMCQDYETATMAELLGQNLQYGLRNTTKEVPLEEEIHQLNIYRAILAYQYNERIQFNICIDRELYSCHVLKLVFQPIVENAVSMVLQTVIRSCILIFWDIETRTAYISRFPMMDVV